MVLSSPRLANQGLSEISDYEWPTPGLAERADAGCRWGHPPPVKELPHCVPSRMARSEKYPHDLITEEVVR